MIHGELAIGTEAKPTHAKATITLTDNVKEEEMMGMGDRGIMLSGGTLNLHGTAPTPGPSWRRPPRPAATSIEVLNAAQWKAWATRSSWPPRTSIPARPSVAPSPPSAATRSRSTRSSTTCTSARSPSTWMSAAKWAC
jgi:hypothetical protein